MNINLRVRLSTGDAAWLCFRHAVLRALGTDQNIELEVYEYGEHWGGPTSCVDCRIDVERRAAKGRDKT